MPQISTKCGNQEAFKAWLQSQSTATPLPAERGLRALANLLESGSGKLSTLVPLLPGLLTLRGKPYTLTNHFPMEPLFSLNKPWRSIYCCGRQVSKCVCIHSLMELADGRLVRAGDVQLGDQLLSIDDRTLTTIPGEVVNVWRSTRDDLFEVTTRTGSTLTLSGEHKIRTRYGYAPLKELSVGSRVAVIERAANYGRRRIPGNLLGTMDGDVLWDEITGIARVPGGEVVDFEIKDYHNFAVDGVVTHNSTSLAAQGLITTATLPFFQSLYVLPLYEMTRRFSSNYMRAFIEESPIKPLMMDSKCENSVLQKTMVNKARMFFSYACLDADRIRGLAVDSVTYDECVRKNFPVQTVDGYRLIGSTLKIGDKLLAHDESGHIVTDEVVNVVCKGERETYRITLEDGRYLECTLNEKLRTNRGWLYLQDMLDDPSILVLALPMQSKEQIRRMGFLVEAGRSAAPRLSEENRLVECRIQSIEYIGRHEVWDVETKEHHTLFANGFAVHNCQDLDFDHLPIIRETMSASSYGFEQFSGTPKTLDNTMEVLWERSSQAEWCIPCAACNHHNIPRSEFDLIKMLGPVKNVVKFGTGLICAKCGRPIEAPTGFWLHRYPDRASTFAGYHAPQMIFPLHYADERKWAVLLHKKDNTAPAVFINECAGESCDVGTKLVTLTDLKQASTLHKLDWKVCTGLRFTSSYIFRVLGIDWGGRGASETSFTTLTVLGVTPTGKYDVIWAERLSLITNDVDEVRRIVEVYNIFSCHLLAHDFGGSGSVHETLLIQAGFPVNKIMPCVYTYMTSKKLILHNEPPEGSTRHYYSVDKTRSLLLLCTLVKAGYLRFPEYESAKDVTEDLLHLVKDKTETARAGDIVLIHRQPGQPDDFAHSTNFALCCAYHFLGQFPDLARTLDLTLTPEQLNVAAPPDRLATYEDVDEPVDEVY